MQPNQSAFLDETLVSHGRLQHVERTLYFSLGLISQSRVCHGCFYILMAQQFLNEADIGALLYQMCGVGVPQAVHTDFFIYSGFLHSTFKDLLHGTDSLLTTLLAFEQVTRWPI